MALSGKQRRFLRSLGHALRPVVTVGAKGIDDGLLAELATALRVHELVKVKILASAPLDRKETAAELGRRAEAELAQVLGRTALLYKARKKNPAIKLPAAAEPG
jgi:RNA-binding protein